MSTFCEIESLPEISTDVMVTSIIEHRECFLTRLGAWRKSRADYMNAVHSEPQSMSNQIHVDGRKDSYTQTNGISDLPTEKADQSQSSVVRLRSACPIIFSYLIKYADSAAMFALILS